MKDLFKRLSAGAGAVQTSKATEVQDENIEATVEALTAKLAESEAKVAELSAVLTQFAEMQAEAEVKAKAAKLEARKNAVFSAVGTARGVALFEKTKEMSDESFATVMDAVGISQNLENSSSLFSETGIEAEADLSKVTEQNGVMDYLLSKFKPQ